MAGVHRLQHIECFSASAFANDDAFRPHAKCVTHQVGSRDLAFSFNVRRAGFQSYGVFLLKLQFSGIFNRDNPLVARNEV